MGRAGRRAGAGLPERTAGVRGVRGRPDRTAAAARPHRRTDRCLPGARPGEGLWSSRADDHHIRYGGRQSASRRTGGLAQPSAADGDHCRPPAAHDQHRCESDDPARSALRLPRTDLSLAGRRAGQYPGLAVRGVAAGGRGRGRTEPPSRTRAPQRVVLRTADPRRRRVGHAAGTSTRCPDSAVLPTGGSSSAER